MKSRQSRNELPPDDSFLASLPGIIGFILTNFGFIGFMAFKSYTALMIGAIGVFIIWLLYW